MKQIKLFFKTLIELPDRHIELLTARIEQVKMDRDIREKCVEASWSLPRIKDEDIIVAREYLIQGDSIGAIRALILYINKTSK